MGSLSINPMMDNSPAKIIKVTKENEKELMIQARNQFEKVYEEGKFLGEGCSSVVKSCVHRESGLEYAVKIMRTDDEEKILVA